MADWFTANAPPGTAQPSATPEPYDIGVAYGDQVYQGHGQWKPLSDYIGSHNNAPTQQGDWFTQNAPPQPPQGPANAPSTPDLGPDAAGAAYMAQFGEQGPFQPLSPQDMARTGQVSSEPSSVTAGTEPTKISEALRANIQPMFEHPIDSVTGMFTNWDDVKHLYQQPQDILGPAAKREFGMPVSPDEEVGSQQWWNTAVAAALAAGALRGGRGKPTEVAPEAPPQGVVPETAKVAPESDLQWQGDPVVQGDLRTSEANAKLETPGPPPAPAPEEATQAPPNVREALSLDEIRLMREKSDLQLQQDLAKRATGTSHPAVDDRISQIDDELDNIANSALQPSTPELPPDVRESLQQQPTPKARPAPDLQPKPVDETIPVDEQKYAGMAGLPEGQQPAQAPGTASVERPATGEVIPSAGQDAGSSVVGTQGAPEIGARHEALHDLYGDVIQHGEGRGAEELANLGRKRLVTGGAQNDPYPLAYKIARGQPVAPEDAALVYAEHERLGNIASQLEKQAEANPTPRNLAAYEDARKQSENYAVSVVKPAGTMAGDLLRQLQAVSPPDPDTLTGLRQTAINSLKRELTPSEASRVAKVKSRMDAVNAATDASMEKLSSAIERRTRGVKTPTDQELGKMFNDLKEKLTPCK